MQTGVSVPANTVTVNPSANTSSNTGTATSENFNTSNEATVSSETAKKNAEILAEIKEIISRHFHTHNEPKHVFKYIHAEWSFRIKRNIRFRFQCRQPAFLLWESDLYDSVILTECRYNGHGQLQKVLSYAEYQLLTSHYTNMVDIISVLGSTGLSTENDSDDSLSHLFELATQQNMRKVINVMGNSTSLL